MSSAVITIFSLSAVHCSSTPHSLHAAVPIVARFLCSAMGNSVSRLLFTYSCNTDVSFIFRSIIGLTHRFLYSNDRKSISTFRHHV